MATDEQFLKSQSIARWRKEQIDLHKKPTVFVLGR
jgi:16S rRNA (cytidine1402-2'-O)-methyltransferase